MSANDGGPAFPNQQSNSRWNQRYDGMSLRDWFAGQALAGITMRPDCVGMMESDMAELAYRFADAMLAERDKERPE